MLASWTSIQWHWLPLLFPAHIFPVTTCDTLHSFFRIPVVADDQHTINFRIARFKVLTIDEASMIDETMINLLADTLNKLVKRLVVIFAGDERQQQPLRTTGCTTSQVASIQSYGTLHGVSQKYSHHRFHCIERVYSPVLGVLCLTGRKIRDFSLKWVADATIAPPKIFAGAYARPRTGMDFPLAFMTPRPRTVNLACKHYDTTGAGE